MANYSIRFLNKNGLVNSPDCLARAPEGCLLAATPNAFDAPRAIRTRLDKPSQISGINEKNMYTEPSLLNYAAGFNYPSYCDTNNAQVTYYVDETIAKPFFGPNFGQGCPFVYYENYVDPMSSWKPHYYYEMQRPQNSSQLSWINDSTFFREDLMSRQMAKMNQVRSEPFL
jgi:hypothetical protein